MKATFVQHKLNLPYPLHPATHQYLPRRVRKALRVVIPKGKPQTYTNWDVDVELRTDHIDPVLHQNLEFLDRAYDFDEFGDIDNEFDGLTIVEPMNEVELFSFCTGYDVF
jgi:hypothetical protein